MRNQSNIPVPRRRARPKERAPARPSMPTGPMRLARMIALSFAFYTPVILWVGQVPLLGMLMIPKTCAYIAVALIAYRSLYPRRTALETKPA